MTSLSFVLIYLKELLYVWEALGFHFLSLLLFCLLKFYVNGALSRLDGGRNCITGAGTSGGRKVRRKDGHKVDTVRPSERSGGRRKQELYFEYGDKETEYLKSRDNKLGAVIDNIGHIYRETDDDLFSSVIHHIIGQQISSKAQHTVWNRLKEQTGDINAERIAGAEISTLQSCGMTFRKAEYIKEFAEKVRSGSFDLNEIYMLPDDKAIQKLTSLRGIGVWTAEMILLFCLQRPDIFSFDDLAIQRGLRMLYHHKKITRELFEKYRRRFSPCCSVASLYLWAVASGWRK